MTTIKLKFKLETLYKILKQSTSDSTNKPIDNKTSKKPTSVSLSSKHSGRTSKILNNDFDTLPSYDREMSKLPIEEKDEVLTLMKSIDFSLLFSIFTLLQNKQYYNKLKSKPGLELIRIYFNDIVKSKSGEYNSDHDTIYNSQESLIINDECELFNYLSDILNISELEAMDIFDLFKFNEFQALTEKNFIILIYLLAAFECGHLEDFVNLFYEDLFKMISGEEEVIAVSRLKEVGGVLNFDEKVLTRICNEMSLEINSVVDLAKFKNFYVVLAKVHDEQNKSQSNVVVKNTSGVTTTSSPVKKGQAKTGNCISKACNIL